MDRLAQQNNDQTVINALSNNGQPNTNQQNTAGMYTVFVPANDAYNYLPTDNDQLKNDIYNFIVKGLYFILYKFIKNYIV